MDPKTRYERLKEAHAEGRLSDAEFQALSRKPPQDKGQDDDLQSSDLRDSQDKKNPDVFPVPHIPYLEMLQPGMEIGPQGRRFRLEHRLGQEEQSRVWLARLLSGETSPNDKKRSSLRALKIFARRLEDQSLAHGTSQHDRVSRMDLLTLRASLVKIKVRATLAATLKHPNIVKVYGWHHGEDSWPFVEMEYLVGRSLDQVLHQEGNPGLGWTRALTLLQPVASVLDYVHREHHLAHRNLKPGNVLVTDRDVVKVLDFGLTHQSKEPQGAPSRSEIDSGEGPESTGISQIKFKQDVGALAALFYELLTGKPPYGKEMPVGQDPHTWPMFGRTTQPAVSRSEEVAKPAELTEAAWTMLQAGMAYRRETCPASAEELLGRLQAAQNPVPARQPRKIFRWLAATAVLSGVVGGGFYLLDKATSRPPQSDDQAFAAAQQRGTEKAYRLYLQNCTACAHRQEAEAALEALQQNARIDDLKARFETYLQTDQFAEGADKQALAVLEELRRLAPRDSFIAAGRSRIAQAYGELARASLAAGDYAEARRRLEQGRQVQPDLALWSSLAAALVQAQAQAQDKARDETAYNRARERNTQRAYQDYLAGCAPLCAYEEQAQAALEQLKVPPPSPGNPLFLDTLADGAQGPEMVLIPPGRFRMGSPAGETGRYDDEGPRTVTLDYAFAIGRYEVTFEDYDRFARASDRPLPEDEGWGRGARPVINVSWDDAQAYAGWLSEQTGQRYRLPTEAEWEYAARAGTGTARYWGQDPDQGCRYANGADLTGKAMFTSWTVMNCRDDYVYTASVGLYRPNQYGLYDMLGNVLEWTCSLYDPGYRGREQRCAEPVGEEPFAVRGGSWSDQPRHLRSADRQKFSANFHDYFLGFRVVREP